MSSSDGRTPAPSGPTAPPTACDRSINARTKSSLACAADKAGRHSSPTAASAATPQTLGGDICAIVNDGRVQAEGRQTAAPVVVDVEGGLPTALQPVYQSIPKLTRKILGRSTEVGAGHDGLSSVWYARLSFELNRLMTSRLMFERVLPNRRILPKRISTCVIRSPYASYGAMSGTVTFGTAASGRPSVARMVGSLAW